MSDPAMIDRIIDALRAAAASVVGENAVDIEPVGDPTEYPALDIFDDGYAVIERGTGYTRKRHNFRIEGFAERGDGTEATAERNALHASLVRCVMADETLGGLVDLIEEGDRRNGAAELSEHRRLMFGQDFAIEYVTDRYDPALPA